MGAQTVGGYGICIPTTTTTTTNPCLANNGGCSNQRTCQYKNGQKSCGPCPKGYHAKGTNDCEKDTTTTPQPNCVFCDRDPPIAFMLDRSGSMSWCMGRPNDWSCRKPNRRYDKITAEILLMLSTMPDGTKFHVQAYSNGHWAFNNNQYMLNSVAARNALTQWFVKMSPHGGTYMTTGLTLCSRKRVKPRRFTCWRTVQQTRARHRCTLLLGRLDSRSTSWASI